MFLVTGELEEECMCVCVCVCERERERERERENSNNNNSYIALYPLQIYELAALYNQKSTCTIAAYININMTKSQDETKKERKKKEKKEKKHK